MLDIDRVGACLVSPGCDTVLALAISPHQAFAQISFIEAVHAHFLLAVQPGWWLCRPCWSDPTDRLWCPFLGCHHLFVDAVVPQLVVDFP